MDGDDVTEGEEPRAVGDARAPDGKVQRVRSRLFVVRGGPSGSPRKRARGGVLPLGGSFRASPRASPRCSPPDPAFVLFSPQTDAAAPPRRSAVKRGRRRGQEANTEAKRVEMRGTSLPAVVPPRVRVSAASRSVRRGRRKDGTGRVVPCRRGRARRRRRAAPPPRSRHRRPSPPRGWSSAMTTRGFRNLRDVRRVRMRDERDVRAHAVSPPERASFRAALRTTMRVDFVVRVRVWSLTR